MAMNKELQIHKLKQIIGQDSDLIDLEAEIDETLTFPENLNHLWDKIDMVKGKRQDYNKKEVESMQQRYDNQRINEETELQIDQVFRRHSVLGVVGSRHTGKTMLVLTQLIEAKKKYPKLRIAVFGVEESLKPLMESYGITFLESKMDILDIRLKDTLIFIDEMALFFNTESKNKHLDKLMRFFDRLEHLNDKLILSTAREGYFTKFMCSRITAFLVKQVEYDALVNGTWLKERVKAIKSSSDYRLEICQDEYYTITNTGETAEKHKFSYNKEIDSKKENTSIFT